MPNPETEKHPDLRFAAIDVLTGMAASSPVIAPRETVRKEGQRWSAGRSFGAKAGASLRQASATMTSTKQPVKAPRLARAVNREEWAELR